MEDVVDRFLTEKLKDLRARLHEHLKADFERRVAELKKQLEAASAMSLEDYRRQMEQVAGWRAQGKNSPAVLNAYERSVKQTLDGTLDCNRRLLDDFIRDCADLMR